MPPRSTLKLPRYSRFAARRRIAAMTKKLLSINHMAISRCSSTYRRTPTVFAVVRRIPADVGRSLVSHKRNSACACRTRCPPHLMSRDERLAEVSRLLALGLVRLRDRQSSEVSAVTLERVRFTTRPGESGHAKPQVPESRMTDPIPARLAALKMMTLPELRAEWRYPVWHRAAELQPPIHRKPARLPRPGAGLRRTETRDGQAPRGARRAIRRPQRHPATASAHDARPIAGTRLIREWQGVEQTVTVLAEGYEWQGRPDRSLSAIARAITGTRWNGLVFFGLKSQRGAT